MPPIRKTSASPRSGARRRDPTPRPPRCPGLIQDVFPGYAGAAWYWRDVEIPANPHEGGRYLLRFWDVDYLADVWVNGTHIGRHEGAQAKFDIRCNGRRQAGRRRIASPFASCRRSTSRSTASSAVKRRTAAFVSFNLGGIVDSVELVITPQVRMDDLFVRADPKTGKIRVEAEVFNAAKDAVHGSIDFSVAPATSGEAVVATTVDQELKPGVNKVSAEMQLANPRLWELNDPYLYRMTARVAAAGSKSTSETSTRFGFRDFRFENGYFRLNGRRVFWRSAHTGADSPGSIRLPHDPDLLRRDLLSLKMSGFNAVRFISTQPPRYQLEMCDEIGLMVYEESYASWLFSDSPQMAERMARSLTGMVLRDRNHPSIVMWGLLNETPEGNVFSQAVASLPLVRSLDDSRVVLLGSGRFDADRQLSERSADMEAGIRLRALRGVQSEGLRDVRRRAVPGENGRADPRRQRRVQRGPMDRAGRRRVCRLGQVPRHRHVHDHRRSCPPERKASLQQFHQRQRMRRPL